MSTNTTGSVTGSYDYSELRNLLKQQGVRTKDLSSALKIVESDNDIDNIKELNGEEEITVSQDVWTQYAKETGTTPAVENTSSDLLSLYVNAATVPTTEIYNDDDYEVADYDEYYGFGQSELPDSSLNPDEYAQQYANENNMTLDEAKEYLSSTYGNPEEAGSDEENSTGEEIDLETFKTQYGSQFVSNTIQDRDSALEEIFNSLDTNSNETLSESELAAAFYAGAAQPEKNDEVDTTTTGGEDLLGGDMMEMDMSGDSFNPQ